MTMSQNPTETQNQADGSEDVRTRSDYHHKLFTKAFVDSGMKLKELSRRAKVPYGSLWHVVHHKREWKVSMWIRVMDALGAFYKSDSGFVVKVDGGVQTKPLPKIRNVAR